MCKPCIITAILFLAIVVAGFLFLWNEARAENITENILINEIQISDKEFVELYNYSATSTSLDGLYFAYYSANRNNWNNPWRIKPFSETDGTQISAEGYFLLGFDGYPEPDSDWQVYESRQLSDSGGAVAIFSYDPREHENPEPIDAVGWGEAQLYMENPVLIEDLNKSESISRNSNHTNTNNNSDDFSILTTPTPQRSSVEKETEEDPAEEETEEQTQEEESEAKEDSTTETKKEDAAEPSIDIEYPSEIYTDEEWFAVDLHAYDLPNADYDVKVSILDTNKKNISNIYNYKDKNFQTAFQYVQNAFSGTSFKGSFLKHINSNNLGYDGNAFVVAQIREHGKSNILLKTEGSVLIHGTEAKEKEEHTVTSSEDVTDNTSDSNDENNSFTKTNDIKITEFVPYAEGADAENEWVEIYNSGNKTHDLADWQLAVTEGKSGPSTFSENTLIAPREYRVFWRPATKLTLINSGDTLELLYPNEDTAQEISYPKSPKGESYALVNGKWTWTDNITPGYANLPPSKNEITATKDTIRTTSSNNDSNYENIGKSDTAIAETSTPEAFSAQVSPATSANSILYFAIAGIISLASGGVYLFIKKQNKM